MITNVWHQEKYKTRQKNTLREESVLLGLSGATDPFQSVPDKKQNIMAEVISKRPQGYTIRELSSNKDQFKA